LNYDAFRTYAICVQIRFAQVVIDYPDVFLGPVALMQRYQVSINFSLRSKLSLLY